MGTIILKEKKELVAYKLESLAPLGLFWEKLCK